MHTTTLPPREDTTGRFTFKAQGTPEVTLDTPKHVSFAAAELIRDVAPIGAATAHVRFDDDRTGQLLLSRFTDHNGRTVPTDDESVINVALSAANPDDFARAYAVTAFDSDGEQQFTIDLGV